MTPKNLTTSPGSKYLRSKQIIFSVHIDLQYRYHASYALVDVSIFVCLVTRLGIYLDRRYQPDTR